MDKLRNAMNLDKDQILDKLHWLKQLIAAGLGLVFGVLALEGWICIILFVGAVLLATLACIRSVFKIEDEDSDEFNKLMFEGLPASVALFLLTWVTSFNLIHAAPTTA